MIEIENVSKRIGSKTVLKNLSMSLLPNKVTAICGPNGAGKTTLIRMILGLLKADSGKIISRMNWSELAFLLHNCCLFPELTLKQNIDFFLGLKGIKIDSLLFENYLSVLDLEEVLFKKINTFSEGMLQKADLMRAFIEKPKFLILDEPSANLDPVGKVEIRKIIKSAVLEGQFGVLITSHLLDEVEKIADHIIIINEGIIKWQGDERSLLVENVDLESKFMQILTNFSESKD